MARYYATVTNGRGNTSAVGGRASVNSAHIRAWDVGVRIETYTGAGRDQLTIYLTGGSHGETNRKLLGTVMIDDNGDPVFVAEFAINADHAPAHITDAGLLENMR